MADETYTLLDAWHEASHRLWKGRKNEKQSRLRFMMVMDVLGRDTPLAHIKKRELEMLVEYFENTIIEKTGRPYAPGTINRILAGASKILRWAYDSEIIDRMPKIPWCEDRAVKDVFLPSDKIPEFLETVYSYRGHDVSVAIQALILTGMRVGELVSLKPDQLQGSVNGYYVLVRAEKTKTFRNRIVPIPEQLYNDLCQLLKTGVPSYRVLYDTCTMVSQALNLTPEITPHVLRHTTATIMTQMGVPSLTVANLLGHSSLATTRRYAHHAPATNPLQSLHMNIGAMGVHLPEKPVVDHQKHWRYLRKRREINTVDICSPLRSHSATRPSMCNPLKTNDPED
jgi:integrase